jgi:hemoglobin/transferrin/lactoferrin receptor protein
VSARWLYSRPDDRLFDFDVNTYWTKTSMDQTLATALPGGIGSVGDKRNFTINTYGIDLHNTSRFDWGPVRNAITVGLDGFRDEVDTEGFGVVFTPSGRRTVSGGFAQWKANYSTWLEVIGGLRYDQYNLEGGGVESDGNRVSPKITVGITPFAGFTPYVTYAEGYRAPAITETLITGVHPVPGADFEFLPNPTLKPEVGKTTEAGINLKYNDVFQKGDAFRAKFAVFRNNVDNFIDQELVPSGTSGVGGIPCNAAGPPGFPFCLQYQNVEKARLEGAEFEAAYDTGFWFAQLAASHVRGRDLTNDVPLSTVLPDKVAVTLGARWLDRKLTTSVRVLGVAAQNDVPPGSVTSPGYGVVNLYAGYEASRDVLLNFAIENLFDKQYAPYLNASAVAPLPYPGFTAKAGIQIRFSDAYFKKG